MLLDGTYIPAGNRQNTGHVNYSGKRCCQCLSVQVASTLTRILLDVSTPEVGPVTRTPSWRVGTVRKTVDLVLA